MPKDCADPCSDRDFEGARPSGRAAHNPRPTRPRRYRTASADRGRKGLAASRARCAERPSAWNRHTPPAHSGSGESLQWRAFHSEVSREKRGRFRRPGPGRARSRCCSLQTSVYVTKTQCSTGRGGRVAYHREQMLSLSSYSFGVGDRFAQQARAQRRAVVLASEQNVDLVPVWNKSNREHTFIGTEPPSVLHAAQKAVQELNWKKPWHIDADHINLDTVERFLAPSDFFTIDVAHLIGQPAAHVDVDSCVSSHAELGESEDVRKTANKY